jgi:hypothetical protein
MLVFTVEPGSTTADAMKILASWSAPAYSDAGTDVSAEA